MQKVIILMGMSLSEGQLETYLAFLKKELEGRYISSPSVYAKNVFTFHLSSPSYRSLIVALDSSFPRIYLREEELEGSSLESPLLLLLKKEIGNAYIEEVSKLIGDRIVKLSLSVANQVFKEERKHLYIELIPNHPNLILTDEKERILLAYRCTSIDDKRPIVKGLIYQSPENSLTSKQNNPFSLNEYLKACEEKEKELETARKNEKFGFAITYYKNKKKLLERKIKKLENDILEANKHLNDGDKGNAIFICYSSLKPKQASFEYEGEIIQLDPSKSLASNAESYFKRAKKAKETIKHSSNYLLETKNELEEVESALAQLSIANEASLEAFAKDLNIPTPSNKKKDKGLTKDNLPYYVEYNGTKILFGKNAKQNTFLTFMYDTSKEHLYFHVLAHSGSHVIIKKDEPSDEEIRIAAEICLINSSLEDGDIMMSKRKNVRRGRVLGEALVKECETIHLKKISSSTKELLKSAKRISLK